MTLSPKATNVLAYTLSILIGLVLGGVAFLIAWLILRIGALVFLLP